MNKTNKSVSSILAIALLLAFMTYAGYKIGYNTGFKSGWHGAVEQIRYQAGDIVYPANIAGSSFDEGILLDNIDNELPSASIDTN